MINNKVELLGLTYEAEKELEDNIEKNLHLYIKGDFKKFYNRQDWRLETGFFYDPNLLKNLSKGESSKEVEDSLIIFKTFEKLTPMAACQSNIWVHLAHGPLLEFSRQRWIKPKPTNEENVKDIEKHFFPGNSLNGLRDDHAISRLWWNGYHASCRTNSKNNQMIKSYLTPFLRTTDTRLNFFERSGIATDKFLTTNLSDYLTKNQKIKGLDKEQKFRDFIIKLNLKSAGIIFNSFSKKEINKFFDECVNEIN